MSHHKSIGVPESTSRGLESLVPRGWRHSGSFSTPICCALPVYHDVGFADTAIEGGALAPTSLYFQVSADLCQFARCADLCACHVRLDAARVMSYDLRDCERPTSRDFGLRIRRRARSCFHDVAVTHELCRSVHPNYLTVAAAVFGIACTWLASKGSYNAAFACWVLNRTLDGMRPFTVRGAMRN